jgi:hypothetical protein
MPAPRTITDQEVGSEISKLERFYNKKDAYQDGIIQKPRLDTENFAKWMILWTWKYMAYPPLCKPGAGQDGG